MISQSQPGDPCALDVELLIEGTAGEQVRHRARLSAARGIVRVPFTGTVARVVVDPGFEILRWDESYRMPAPPG